MKVKIHKNTVRRIISEELDRLELIYERVSGGSGKFNVRYNRGVTTSFRDASESTACSARRVKISDNINDLNNEIKGAAKSVIEDLKELLRKDVDRGGFKDFQGKLTYITYVPFVFKQDEEGLAGVVKENEGPGSSFIAKARARAQAVMDRHGHTGDLEGQDYSNFDLINAVGEDGCPGSYSFRIKIAGESGKSYSSREVQLYQKINELVGEHSEIKMRQAINPDDDPGDAFSGITSLSANIQYIDAVSPPSQSDLFQTYSQVIAGIDMCAVGGGDGATMGDLLGDEVESTGDVKLVPCADLEIARTKDQVEREDREREEEEEAETAAYEAEQKEQRQARARQIAKALHETMDGYTTDETAFWGITNGLDDEMKELGYL